MKKFFGRFIRWGMVSLIVLFCGTSILLSLLRRDAPPSFQKNLGYISFFEDRFFDFRMSRSLHGNSLNSDDLVLAAIGDEDLKALGRWPWPRMIWVQFLNKMTAYGAKVVAFDVFFSEEEKSEASSPDEQFALAVASFQKKAGRRVLIPYSVLPTNSPPGDALESTPENLFNFVLATREGDATGLFPRKVSVFTWPVKKLLKSDPGLGFIMAEEDLDGIFRHYPLITNVDSLHFPSFALLAYSLYANDKPILVISEKGYSAALNISTGQLPLNYKGEVKLRWMGPPRGFPTVGIAKILNAPADDQEMLQTFKDKLVFVGSTAYAAHDLRHTPMDPILPGIYFQMNIVNMMLKGHFFQDLSDSVWPSLLILLIGSLILVLAMIPGLALLDITALVLVSVSAYLLDTWYFLPSGHEIKLFFCLLAFVAITFWNILIDLYLVASEKKKIRQTFSRYVAPSIVNEILGHAGDLKLGGIKRVITCLFSDIRDFTSLSEKLSAKEISFCLNQYFNVMTDLIFSQKGTLDKYIGDELVAYWGAPLPLENHAFLAATCAVRMAEALPAVNSVFRAEGKPEWNVGIGLNTGECSVGNMGSEKIFSYTAIGDPMNLGSRLQGLCRYFDTRIIASAAVFQNMTPEQAHSLIRRPLGLVRVKGRAQSVEIFDLLPHGHPFRDSHEAMKSFSEAIALFRKGNFQRTIALLAPLRNACPDDGPTKLFTELAEQYEKNPPPDWEGVIEFTEK